MRTVISGSRAEWRAVELIKIYRRLRKNCEHLFRLDAGIPSSNGSDLRRERMFGLRTRTDNRPLSEARNCSSRALKKRALNETTAWAPPPVSLAAGALPVTAAKL